MDDLSYFLWLSDQVNEKMICDLSDERQPSQKKEEKKKNRLPIKEPKPEKEKKIKTITLQAASESDQEMPEQEDGGNEDANDYSEYDEENGEENQYKFSAIKVPVNVDINKKKGKNKYQKLREARYQDKLDAQDPQAAAMEKVKILAAGGKIGPTAAQIEKSMKKDKKEKRKKYEKKIEKEAKEKRNEMKNEKRNNFKKKNAKNNKSNNNKPKVQSRPNFKKGKK